MKNKYTIRRNVDKFVGDNKGVLEIVFDHEKRIKKLEQKFCLTKIPNGQRECELCKTIIYSVKGMGRKIYYNWTKKAHQSGLSKKYPGELAGYCEKHQ